MYKSIVGIRKKSRGGGAVSGGVEDGVRGPGGDDHQNCLRAPARSQKFPLFAGTAVGQANFRQHFFLYSGR